MIQPARPTDYYCLIFDSANRSIGEISYHRLDLNIKTVNLNLKIVSLQRGKGYAPAAMGLFLDRFFNQVGKREMTFNLSANGTLVFVS